MWFLQTIQVLVSLLLIGLILVQTTRAEGAGGLMGMGTIGGQTRAAFKTRSGFEEHIGRITAWVASVWLVVSAILSVLFLMRR